MPNQNQNQNQNDKRRQSQNPDQTSPEREDEQRYGQEQPGQSPSRQGGSFDDENAPRKNAGGDRGVSGDEWRDRDESREAGQGSTTRKGP